MTPDPKRSPIAALLPKWKEWADSDERSARNAVADEPNEDWRNDERGIRAVWLRQACRELEAAIAAQAEVWREETPTPETSENAYNALIDVGRAKAISQCSRDLSGLPSLSDPCQHPARNGQHELYLRGEGSFCRACGAAGLLRRMADAVRKSRTAASGFALVELDNLTNTVDDYLKGEPSPEHTKPIHESSMQPAKENERGE